VREVVIPPCKEALFARSIRGGRLTTLARRPQPLSNLLIYSIPAFLALLVLELAWTRRHRAERGLLGYERRDTLASLTMGIGNVIISAFTTLGAIAVWELAHRHRVVDVTVAPPVIAGVLLFLGEDLCYYVFHRTHHHVRLLWVAHVHHHSSQYFNLSTALRQPWFTPLTGPWFWIPLALVGFTPPMILTAQAASLIYQFWIHTEVIRKLPAPLEWVLNTPSHHRVHHGKNLLYLDRNHGGVLIVWDRLFGTFQPETEPVRYGVTKDVSSFNPLRIATHELVSLARDVKASRSIREAMHCVLGPPSRGAEAPAVARVASAEGKNPSATPAA
jgi:sterol desaturase/sphingolipid hydroxylase (fatty acid hydroxylase superfamily)